MQTTSNALSDLSTILSRSESSGDSVYSTLANKASSSKDIQRAKSQLKENVSEALNALEKAPIVAGKSAEYRDYCRRFGAYLLAFGTKDEKAQKAFAYTLDMLEQVAPSFKSDVRALRRQFKEERSYISQLGFDWDVLEAPFIVDRFANMLLRTEISVEAEPTVIVVEKEVEKVVVKEVVKEVAPQGDPNDFGREGHKVEFKSSFVNTCNDKPQIWNICKAVCAFLNSEGGTLYIGVGDNGRAIPAKMNGFDAGIHEDIRYLRDARRLPYGKSTVDAYCLHVKFAIMSKFRECNDVAKFESNVIVSETHNDNVIKVEVTPSRYCIVKLEGIAYHRSGASSPEMNDEQVELRMFELYSVSPEVHYRRILLKAIGEKRQAILYAYASTNSATISDRYVEPVNFVCDGHSVICYDTVKQGTRQFKLSRIGDIRILDTGWQFESEHEKIQADIFGWTNTGENFPICLDMKLPAMTYLIENHPNAKKDDFTKLENGWWRLEVNVHSLDPVRNFFLSFADVIEIRETSASEMLKENARRYVQEVVMGKLG